MMINRKKIIFKLQLFYLTLNWCINNPFVRQSKMMLCLKKMRAFKLRYNVRHLGQSEDWIFCASLVTSTCKVWCNTLFHICQVLFCRYWIGKLLLPLHMITQFDIKSHKRAIPTHHDRDVYVRPAEVLGGLWRVVPHDKHLVEVRQPLEPRDGLDKHVGPLIRQHHHCRGEHDDE